MPEQTLAERHARIGALLDEIGGCKTPTGWAPSYEYQSLVALLAFARGEWDRAGRIGLKVGRYSAEVDEILTRLESALAPLMGEK